ncbi:uncharacterized protein K460DRAFT_327379 [Cucurbitaria berberidis CBS 394.84]|uniref:Putative gamma-glutamylcyclotransferase n=1 Tax=Cucurbitaria berberidis CBS 394.84 TaxID=1168544 RepID=A0A9P4LDU9_9PLEO|nr:uncharacterized protein K460DRAFT_327379 [Cucurbitaria berberidis CBS 394.84]KAF1850474.1 hypothetical protein K460DRAFT_327379 [Cucurbitaria berberidis CBS 394.84]
MAYPPPPVPPPMPPHLAHALQIPNPSPSSTPQPTPATTTKRPFHPSTLFFYGTLQDPLVLQSILNLPSPPTMRKASLVHPEEENISVRMWGIYPALVIPAATIVSGTVWHCSSAAHFARLEEYETNAYTWCECAVTLDVDINVDVDVNSGEEVLRGCRTFCWAGDAESKELEEGVFDLERWQRNFRGSIVRGR